MSDRGRSAETRAENLGSDARERQTAVRGDVDQRRSDLEGRANEGRADGPQHLDGGADGRTDGNTAAHGDGASAFSSRVGELGLNREAVVDRQKERYGGIKWGSA